MDTAVEVTLGKAAARKNSPKLPEVGFFPQKRFAARSNRRRDIFGALHSPLYLCRGHAKLVEFAQSANDREVFQRENAVPVAIGKVESAGLRAKSAIAASAAVHRAHKALPAQAHAERAVNEHFGFNIDIVHDLGDFLKRHFARKNNSAKARFFGEFRARSRIYRHLRGSVQRHIGKFAS